MRNRSPLSVPFLVLLCLSVVALGASTKATLAPQDELQVFFGNLHSHTSFSDGSNIPEVAYKHARDVAELDFLAITEHNHARAGRIANDHSLYTGPTVISLIPTAERLTVDGQFVAIYGQEFSTISSGNHANVFEVPDVIDTDDVPNGAYDKLLREWLPNHHDSTGQEALLLLNHPATSNSPNDKEYGRDDFNTATAWIAALDVRAQLINIINGPSHKPGTGLDPGKPSQSEFLRYLNLGFHLAPTADQDNHTPNWGNATDARTAVIAPALTRSAILAALRARHVYATEDKNLRVIARVNGHLMGTRVTGNDRPSKDSELDISLEIHDDDEPHADYTVQVFSDEIGDDVAEIIKTVTVNGDSTVEIDGITYDGGRQYIFFKIIQSHDDAEGEDRAWTAPVWFEPGGPSEGVFAVSLSVDLAREEARITNTGDATIDLKGWKLVSVKGDQTFEFKDKLTLEPGESVMVTSGRNAQNDPPHILKWKTGYVWNNDGDPAELFDKSGRLVASTD